MSNYSMLGDSELVLAASSGYVKEFHWARVKLLKHAESPE